MVFFVIKTKLQRPHMRAVVEARSRQKWKNKWTKTKPNNLRTKLGIWKNREIKMLKMKTMSRFGKIRTPCCLELQFWRVRRIRKLKKEEQMVIKHIHTRIYKASLEVGENRTSSLNWARKMRLGRSRTYSFVLSKLRSCSYYFADNDISWTAPSEMESLK